MIYLIYAYSILALPWPSKQACLPPQYGSLVQNCADTCCSPICLRDSDLSVPATLTMKRPHKQLLLILPVTKMSHKGWRS
jgi:hypothetical protein